MEVAKYTTKTLDIQKKNRDNQYMNDFFYLPKEN